MAHCKFKLYFTPTHLKTQPSSSSSPSSSQPQQHPRSWSSTSPRGSCRTPETPRSCCTAQGCTPCRPATWTPPPCRRTSLQGTSGSRTPRRCQPCPGTCPRGTECTGAPTLPPWCRHTFLGRTRCTSRWRLRPRPWSRCPAGTHGTRWSWTPQACLTRFLQKDMTCQIARVLPQTHTHTCTHKDKTRTRQ